MENLRLIRARSYPCMSSTTRSHALFLFYLIPYTFIFTCAALKNCSRRPDFKLACANSARVFEVFQCCCIHTKFTYRKSITYHTQRGAFDVVAVFFFGWHVTRRGQRVAKRFSNKYTRFLLDTATAILEIFKKKTNLKSKRLLA